MPGVSMKFVILDDPSPRLIGLQRRTQNKILRKAIRAAAKPIRREMKRTAKKATVARRTGHRKGGFGQTGTLSQSISVRIGMNKRTRAIYAVIGPRRGFEKQTGEGTRKPTKYAHLVENGVRPHSTGKGRKTSLVGRIAGRVTGKGHPGFPGRKFMRRAFLSSRHVAQAILIAAIAKGVAEHLAKSSASSASADVDSGD